MIDVRCKIGFHSFGATEVHYGELPKPVCKTAIIERCVRKGCNHARIVCGERKTRFIVPTQYLPSKSVQSSIDEFKELREYVINYLLHKRITHVGKIKVEFTHNGQLCEVIIKAKDEAHWS